MFGRVKFYAVSLKPKPNNFICYCCSKKEAKEYIYNFLKFKNYNHFTQWCVYKNLNQDDPLAFFEYFKNVISNEEKDNYLLHTICYKKKQLASILRMFGGIPPLGCSFELNLEEKYFITNLKKDSTKKREVSEK